MKKKTARILAMVCTASVILTACGSTDSTETKAENSSETAENETAEDEEVEPESIEYIQVSIDDMFSDLNSNAYNANVSYKDSYIEVSGKVSEIDPNGEYFVLVSDTAEGNQIVKCVPTGDEVLAGLTEISIGGRAVVSGKVTEVDVENGYSLDVSSVAVDDGIYTDYLDKDQCGIVEYKIPKGWEDSENIDESDTTTVTSYLKEEKTDSDGWSYYCGLVILTTEVQSTDDIPASEWEDDRMLNCLAKNFCGLLSEETDDVDDAIVANIVSGFRTVEVNGTNGVILKYYQKTGIYNETMWWRSDESHVTMIMYETDLSDPEFDEEAQLVLESLTFTEGVSLESSSNSTVDMSISGEDSLFGSLEEILSGNSKEPETESDKKETQAVKSDDSEKSKLASISDAGNKITLEQYNKIKEGMTYQQVVNIVGSEGSLTANSSAGGISIEMYTWVGDGSYAVAEIGFQNGKVISMTQIGLE